MRLLPGLPSLRQPAVWTVLRRLLAGARRRGVSTCLITTMPNHLHWVVLPRSREALHDATRYVFSQLARALNALLGRKSGKVFDDRFWSTCCANARQAFATFGYVLRNPGGCRPADRPDPYTAADDAVLGGDPFLRAVLGHTAEQRAALLARMAAGPLPFEPLRERLQPRLPGFG